MINNNKATYEKVSRQAHLMLSSACNSLQLLCKGMHRARCDKDQGHHRLHEIPADHTSLTQEGAK